MSTDDVWDALERSLRTGPARGEPLPSDPGPEWDPEARELIRWFRRASLPREPFFLLKWAHVTEPLLFFAALERDIAAGPRCGRAFTGALQEDLHRLRELFSSLHGKEQE